MTRIEFEEILSKFKINDEIAITYGKFGTSEIVYSWNGFSIYFSGDDYAVCKGKTPLFVAKNIEDGYDVNKYGIRAGSEYGCVSLDELAMDDKYVSEIYNLKKNNKDYDIYQSKVREAKEKLVKRDDKNKYIKKYSFDTKDGFIIYLTEIIKYYKNYEINPEDVIVEINKKLVGSPNLEITTDTWKKSLNYGFKTDEELKEVMDKFDAAVNPFINNNPTDYVDLIPISSLLSIDHDNGSNIYKFSITSDKGSVRCLCCNSSLNYQLIYRIDEGNCVDITHGFYISGSDFVKEYININNFGVNADKSSNMVYDVFTKEYKTDDNNLQAIDNDKLFGMISKLDDATNYAKEITLGNNIKKVKIK